MKTSERIVTLPDNTLALEICQEHVGASETQLVYSYERMDGTRLDPTDHNFKRDYWGKIEGAK